MGSLALSWFVALAIATPHVLYAYIWFFPDKWRAAFKSRSVEVFHNTAWALKGAFLKQAPSSLPACMLQYVQRDSDRTAARVQLYSSAASWHGSCTSSCPGAASACGPSPRWSGWLGLRSSQLDRRASLLPETGHMSLDLPALCHSRHRLPELSDPVLCRMRRMAEGCNASSFLPLLMLLRLCCHDSWHMRCICRH